MTDTSWLQEAAERAEAATEGPWYYASSGPLNWVIIIPPGDYEQGFCLKEDADFIANARADLPLALGLLAQAAEALEKFQWAGVDEWGPYCPSCENSEFDGHTEDCQLDALLSRIRAGDGGE